MKEKRGYALHSEVNPLFMLMYVTLNAAITDNIT